MNTQDFANTYRALVDYTSKEYRTAVFARPFATYTHQPGDAVQINYQVEIKREVRVLIMEDDYNLLLADAEMGRTARRLHSHNPAVVEAWDQYRMLLALTAQANP